MPQQKKFTDKEKWCPACTAWLPIDDFYKHSGTPSGRKSRCKNCFSKANAPYVRKHKYGLDDAALIAMWIAQDRKCAICDKPIPFRGATRNVVHIDHDHATDKVRGILCGNCNRGLGGFRDSPEFLQRAIAYLAQSSSSSKSSSSKSS